MPTTKTALNRVRNSFHMLRNFLIENFVAIQEPNSTFFPKFVNGGWHFFEQPSRRVRFVNILSRELYSEFRKLYPITDAKDLKQVLAVSFSNNTLHQIAPLQQEGREVVSYEISADIFIARRFPAIWLPVSLLLSKSVSSQDFTVEVHSEQPWFLASFSERSCSQLRNGLSANLEVFRLMQGVPDGLEHYVLSQDDARGYSLHGLTRVQPAALLPFFSFSYNNTLMLNWRPYTAVLAAVAFLYLATSSAGLAWQKSKMDEAIEMMGDKLNILLGQQEKLAAFQEHINALASEGQRRVPMASPWLLLHLLTENGVTLLDFQQRNKQVAIRGHAPRATDILTLLRQYNGVKSADFTAPVVKVQGSEEFSIRVELIASVSNAAE